MYTHVCMHVHIYIYVCVFTYLFIYMHPYVRLGCILPGPLPPAQVVIGIEVDLQRSRDLEAGLTKTSQRAKHALIRFCKDYAQTTPGFLLFLLYQVW